MNKMIVALVALMGSVASAQVGDLNLVYPDNNANISYLRSNKSVRAAASEFGGIQRIVAGENTATEDYVVVTKAGCEIDVTIVRAERWFDGIKQVVIGQTCN